MILLLHAKAYYAESSVAQVNIPSASGDFGVLPNHVPALNVLKPGVVTVFETPETKKDFFGKLRLISMIQQEYSQYIVPWR